MFQRFRSITALLLVLFLLVTTLPAKVSQAASPTDFTEADALALLQEYRIVRGDQNGNTNVTDRLTRAQAAALFIRSIGMEDLASVLPDLVPFQDAQGHWAAGEIAAVERLGLMKGDPNGNFRPESDITYVEILTVLLRMVEQEPAGPWDPEKIVRAAATLGIVPSGISASAPAIRGKIFWALAVTLSEIEVDGQTLLRKHYDSKPPVIKLDKTVITTQDEKVTITGTAAGAFQVLIQGRPARLDRSTGSFSGEAIVNTGSTTVTVEAIDWARNRETATVTVDRKGTISRLKITGPSFVVARSTTKLTVEATDSRGNPVSLSGVDVEMTGDVATFNVDTQTLKAGSETGRGVLTLKAGNVRATYSFDVVGPSSRAEKLAFASINGGKAPARDQEVTVQVQVLDSDGRLVSDDYGRVVSLDSEGLSGVTIKPSQAQTEKGVATFTLVGTRLGSLTLRASSSGLSTVTQDLEILSDLRVVLSTSTTTLKPDGVTTATIKATLQDRTGRAVNNTTSSDMRIELTATGTDGYLVDSFLTIPRGKSTSSGDDGLYQVGVAPGTVKVTGKFSSNHDLSIQTLSLPIDDPLPGAKFSLSASPSSTNPNGTVTVTLKVQDSGGRTVTAGSYAFQLKVTTSNNDPIQHGLPEGVTLTFKDSNYTPVDDGYAPTNALHDPYFVVGRTDKGVATFTLKYNRSGVVTITPVGKPTDYDAYHPDSGEGPASASTELQAPPLKVTFSGTPAAVMLTATSDLGKEQKGAATSTGKQITVQAKVVDSSGAVVPTYNSSITLTRLTGGDGISNIVGLTKKNAVNGVAEFVVQTNSTQGYDIYKATAGTFTSNELTVAVHKTKPEAPHIVAIRGIKEGDLSPVTGYVAPDADYMDIQLQPQESPVPGEPTHWVKAKVYRKGESREFFTSDAFDLASPVPIVRVPKASLKVGEFQYEVVVNNGAGDSPRSPSLDDTSRAMNAAYYSNYKVNSATYDAGTKKLTLSGTFASGGLVDPSKIRFVKDTNEVSLDDAQVTTLTSSTLVLTLGAAADSIDPDIFAGSVLIKADTGWFTNNTNSQIAQPQSVSVGPMAVIRYAVVDPKSSSRYLYLNGEGLRQGTITPSTITIHGADNQVKLTANDKITSTTDDKVAITLSTNTFNAILALQGPLYLTADTGWLNKGTSSSPARVGAISGNDHPVYLLSRIASAGYNKTTKTLTLTGDFAVGATLDPSKLIFKRSTTGSTWSPTSTATVVVSDADSVQIVLSASDATAFEAQFSTKRIYVDTLEGWLIDEKDRSAPVNPPNSVTFTVP